MILLAIFLPRSFYISYHFVCCVRAIKDLLTAMSMKELAHKRITCKRILCQPITGISLYSTIVRNNNGFLLANNHIAQLLLVEGTIAT